MVNYMAAEGRRRELMTGAERERLAARVYERQSGLTSFLAAAETHRLDLLDEAERDRLTAHAQPAPARRAPFLDGVRQSLGSLLIQAGERLKSTRIKAPMAEA
jgi:hypothetical protein